MVCVTTYARDILYLVVRLFQICQWAQWILLFQAVHVFQLPRSGLCHLVAHLDRLFPVYLGCLKMMIKYKKYMLKQK